MAEEEGMAVDTTSPTTDDLGQLRARVEELQQLQIDAEQAAHDSANRIAYLEQQLQSKGQSQAQDDAHRGEVERLQAELQARDRAAEDGKASSRKVEEVEKEKRELLSVIERLEGDKGELEGELLLCSALLCSSPHLIEHSFSSIITQHTFDHARLAASSRDFAVYLDRPGTISSFEAANRRGRARNRQAGSRLA